jgi:hypothetical protein
MFKGKVYMNDRSTHLREAGAAEVVVIDRLGVADAVDGRDAALIATACGRGLTRHNIPCHPDGNEDA